MESEPNTPQYLSGGRLVAVITSLYFGTFLLALDTTIINVAIPEITTVFGSLNDAGWYGASYLITITVFQPIYGSLYKFFDVSLVYRASILVFEVGSVICAAAKNSPMFIAGRAIAGFGGAGLLQGALSVITQVIPLEKRPMYMGIVISVFGISVCMGPPLGGVFTEHSTWRWCFWINVPIGIFVVAIITIFLRTRSNFNEYRDLSIWRKLASMDPLGAIVLVGALCCLLLALQWGGQTLPWKSPTIIGLLVTSVVLTLIFAYIERKVRERALIPVSIFKNRSIWTGASTLFLIGAYNYGVTFFLPFYFQAAYGIGPIDSGVNFIPFLVPQIVSVALIGVIIRFWGHYIPIMLAGELICVVGTALLTQLAVNTPTVKWATFLVISGIGSGMAMQLPYTAIQLTLQEKDIATGNAIAVLFQQLGGAIAISVGQTITITTITDMLPNRLPHLSPNTIIKAGAAGLQLLVRDPEELLLLRTIWSSAVNYVMIFLVALVAASIPFTLGMDWLDAKRGAKIKENGQLGINKTQSGVSETKHAKSPMEITNVVPGDPDSTHGS